MCAGVGSEEGGFVEIVGIAFGARDVLYWDVEGVEVVESVNDGVHIVLALNASISTT